MRVKMGKAKGTRQAEEGKRADAARPTVALSGVLGPLSMGLVLLAGCNSLNTTASTPGLHDPLLGDAPPTPPAVSQPITPVAALPALPAPNLGTSNAVLAAGLSRPFDNSHDLRINNPRGNSGNDGWAGQGAAPSGDAGGAKLGGPEPVGDPTLRRDPSGVYSPVSNSNSPATTIDQAVEQLKARGVIWKQFVQTGENEEWEVRCSVPNRQNSRLRRNHVARDRDLLSAIRAVIEKIDREQQ
jgi:hypothetical protein